MLEAAGKIDRYTADLYLETFTADEMAYDATLRNLEVLGEAAKGIPETVRQQYAEIDWRGISGLRDILAHAYFALDDATLWEIARTKVPKLMQQLKRIEEEIKGNG